MEEEEAAEAPHFPSLLAEEEEEEEEAAAARALHVPVSFSAEVVEVAEVEQQTELQTEQLTL